MTKMFLYLYPIKDFASSFVPYLYSEESKLSDYEKHITSYPFEVLNDTINERYRKKGYKVVFATFPDKEVYGIKIHPEDLIIKTDTTFADLTGNFIYPDEKKLIQQLGNVEELIIGGYHVQDCVKRMGEEALASGINTLVDLELTDLFFNAYKENKDFDKSTYDLQKFKSYMISRNGTEYIELMELLFNQNYSSPIYGFNSSSRSSTSPK